MQHALADTGAEISALQQIEGAGHDTQVDALLGRASLDVTHVALQREDEPLPGALRVQRGQHAGERHETQRGTVGGAPVVVGDGATGQVGVEAVAQPVEQLPQLVVGEQEEQHHRVGLLGQLVTVGVVTRGLEDPVEAPEVRVLGAVGVPVQLLELVVALELAQHPVGVEGHEHATAHLPPGVELVVGQPEPGPQRGTAARRQQVEHLRCDVGDPGHHDVGVGVVAQAALRRARVPLVELVGTHHAVDLVAVACRVVVRDRGPEPGDLQHQLGAVVAQELQVVSGPIVLPHVVEDRGVDVALVVTEVGIPLARQRVQVHHLGLLGAVAAALPREHRAPEACLPGRRPRLGQPAVAVHQQPAGDLGEAEAEERVDVELVPEHMPPVGLAVEPASRHPCVVPGGVPRTHLQQVRDVEAQQLLCVWFAGQLDVADLPQLGPCALVLEQRRGEVRIADDVPAGCGEWLGDRVVTGGEQRHHLLHPDPLALTDVEREDLLDVVLHLVELPPDLCRSSWIVLAEDPGAGRLGDVDARLPGPYLERDRLGSERAGRDGIEVAPLQLAVPRDHLVGDAAVQPRDDLDASRPVLRRDHPLDTRLMAVGHGHEPAAAQRRLTAGPVTEPQLALHQREPDVVGVPIGQ